MRRELRYAIPISDISKDDEAYNDVEREAKKRKPFRTEYQLQFKQYPLSKESQFAPRSVGGSASDQKQNEELGKTKDLICEF